ncbi:MAG: DUF1826 domain-containing protein [Opitutae bacterium]|nr:DUF1826 domain-containing protein [Opitutae bacterium]
MPARPFDYFRIREVRSFAELVSTPLRDGVNALCWTRSLAGDFGEVAAQLAIRDEGIHELDEERLRALPLTAAGRLAVEAMLGDFRLLRDRQLDPVLNYINGCTRDDEHAIVATDVFSFHADRAPVAIDTYLCTYFGPSSEGLRNEDVQRRVDHPPTRARLLELYGGKDDDGFGEFLSDHSYDLHYAPAAEAQPFSFGNFNLWRIALDYPGNPVPPCIHRAPETRPGETRLLLIS